MDLEPYRPINIRLPCSFSMLLLYRAFSCLCRVFAFTGNALLCHIVLLLGALASLVANCYIVFIADYILIILSYMPIYIVFKALYNLVVSIKDLIVIELATK